MDYLSGLFIFLYVVVGLYIIWCFMAISKKAGYSRWVGFAICLPLMNLFALGTLAFETWPIIRTLKRQEKELQELVELEHTAVCDDCGAAVAEDDKYCSKCGAEFASEKNTCPKCGYEYVDEMIYCPKCGQEIKTQE